jgi:hypothetical protein
MKNMEDFYVSHNYTQRDLLPLSPPSAAAAIALKFHPKTRKGKNNRKKKFEVIRFGKYGRKIS